MAPHPVRDTHENGNYRVVESKSSTMSSLMCCTSTRSQKAMTYKESQKKFLWLDPNRWSGQKTVKKEKVNISVSVVDNFIYTAKGLTQNNVSGSGTFTQNLKLLPGNSEDYGGGEKLKCV